MKHTIKICNPVWATANIELVSIIKPLLSFKAEYWRQGIKRKERKTYDKCLMKKSGGKIYFWTGLIEMVVGFCAEQNVEVDVQYMEPFDLTIYEAELPGITFRDDQVCLINTLLDNLRGILVSFTGSGKTVLGFGCISGFENIKVLWLCHTKDLVIQAYEEGKKFGFNMGRYGAGFKEIDADVVCATRQSFKQIADEYGHLFDMVVVDEVHHAGCAEYVHVLEKVMAPIRLGLTATLPKEGESYLTAVGLLGPVLEELTINQGTELGILAVPRIKLLRTTKDHDIAYMRNYQEVYDAAVVNRKERNDLIAKTAKAHIDKGDTVLILINRIEHGENIVDSLEALGRSAMFVRGATKDTDRMTIKKDLDSGKIQCVVASTVWVEGLNIRNLNVVIIAGAGKSEIRTMQMIGRGLRKTATKDECTVYDIFDNTNKYLIEHFAERLMLYMDNNWL